MKIIVKIKCRCGKWIRLRSSESQDSVLCWNCNSEISIRVQSGRHVEGFVNGKRVGRNQVDVEWIEE